jgi:hypothetical protein
MQGKWLLIGIGIISLILGATLFGLGLFNYPRNEVRSQEIGNQTGYSIVKFNPISNYSSSVTFNITGYYTIGNTTWLKIMNQTGAVEYYEQIINFPIKAQLFNSSKEYVADFQNLGYTNTTVISVSEEQLIKTSVFPLPYLVQVSPFIVLDGLVFLIVGGILSLVKMKKIGEEKNQKLIQLSPLVVAYGLIFWLYSYLIITIVFPILRLVFGFSVNSWTNTLIDFFIPTVGGIFYVLTILIFKKVDLKSNFKEIMAIRKFYYYYQFVFLGTFPLFFLFPLNSIFYAGFFAFLAICIIYFVFIPLVSMPNRQGIIIIALLDFLNEHEVKGCKAKFNSLKIASKEIVELMKPFNLAISESCLTSSISYNALVENDTMAISEIIENVQKTPIEYEKLLPVLQDLACKSDSLGKKGIKALPSLVDKFGKYFSRLIVPLISSIVAAIIVFILKSVFGIGS